MIRYFLLCFAFSPVGAQLYNSLSNNGTTDNGKGYKLEFQGASANNCLQNLGQRWDIQPINWVFSINEIDQSLRISNDQKDPRYFWYINNYFSDSSCNRPNYPNEVDFSQNLSVSYRVRSNKNMQKFAINPMAWYDGGDFFGVQAMSISPTISLIADEWTTVEYELCKGTAEWEDKIGTKNRYMLDRGVGFRISIEDPVLLNTDLDLKIDIDYVRFGEAAKKCVPTGIESNGHLQSSMSIAPNPFQDYFYLTGRTDIERIEILDIHQNIVRNLAYSVGQKIMLDGVVPGIYLFKCYDKNNNVFSIKAIKI